MAWVSVSAGPIHWRGLRQMAAQLGLSVEESRGWLQRSFVFRGDDAAVAQAADAIQDFEKRHNAS